MLKDTLKQIEEDYENLSIFGIEDNEFSWVGRTVVDYKEAKDFIKSSNNKILEAVEEEMQTILNKYNHIVGDKIYPSEQDGYTTYGLRELKDDILKIISDSKK